MARSSSRTGKTGGVKRSDQAVQIVGLARFRRDLSKIDKSLSKEINKYLREIGRSVRDSARAITPVDSGDLRKSIKHSVRAKEMSIFSDSPYANAQEWGTSGKETSKVKPQGVPIKIRRRQMIGHAVFTRRHDIEEHIMDLVPHLARINGFDD